MEARLQVSPVSRYAHGLPRAPLVLLLDLLLALEADGILRGKTPLLADAVRRKEHRSV